GLDHDVLALHRDQRAVVRDAVLAVVLVPRDLEVALEDELAAVDAVDGVGAAVGADGLVAGGRAAAAELVGEQDGLGVVGEGRRVPEGEVLVRGPGGDPRPEPVADVEQDAVTHAGPGRDVLLRVGGDVVAAGGGHEQSRLGLVAAVGEDDRRGGHVRLGRGAQRHLDDGDLVVRRLTVGQFGGRQVRGDGEVDGLVPVRSPAGHQGQRVGAAVGLDGLDVAGVALVADVEDPDAFPGFLDRGALPGAVARVVAAGAVDGGEEQVAVDADVHLGAGADDGADDLGPLRVPDVDDGEAAVVADVGVVPLEGDVGVDGAGEGRRLGDVEYVGHVRAGDDRVRGRDVVGGGGQRRQA